MNKQEIKNFLNRYPGYLKVGVERLSERLDDTSFEDCRAALEEVRAKFRAEEFGTAVTSENTSMISEFEEFLTKNDIKSDDVASVKFWQTQSGAHRYSVVTKSGGQPLEDVKLEIEEFAKIYSPKVHKLPRASTASPVVYEVSLPDIHYGKLSGHTLKEVEDQFLGVIEDLIQKAQGLNIDRILLPIGNDGMNSEGMRMSTTKGTPQQDTGGWKETFRGYWNLIVQAIDYLKIIAPVDVVVISGNHDYERMYYAGDVISGWFRNDANVTVNNSDESRKYYQYGVNMIMFTHGDSEKPADMPLIMATEQPEMFAATSHREAHCGHFHKEQVNEYRGIKVRFIPSICPNDEWHKKMGYAAKRTGQAYIWSKARGLEGYLQSNVE